MRLRDPGCVRGQHRVMTEWRGKTGEVSAEMMASVARFIRVPGVHRIGYIMAMG